MRIVNVRGLPAGAPGITYLGRACRGWPAHPLANPFVLVGEAERGATLAAYRDWLAAKLAADDRRVVTALLDLPPDAALGCWCLTAAAAAPPGAERCHCEVVANAWRRLVLNE